MANTNTQIVQGNVYFVVHQIMVVVPKAHLKNTNTEAMEKNVYFVVQLISVVVLRVLMANTSDNFFY